MNFILEKIRHISVLKILYKLPFIPFLYNTTLAWLGSVIYRHPSQKIFVVGVTGTKGKSTVVELIGYLLKAAGKKVATLSSVGMEIVGQSEDKPLDNTMPGRFFIQHFLDKAVKAGCQYAVIEVTSEGVKLNRHRFIDWSAAIFTNLAPEHLESHGSFEKYREAKLKFFRYLKKDGLFFINENDESAKYFIEAINERLRKAIILYGRSDVLSAALPGEFNQYNIGAAVAFAKSQGIDDEVIKKAIVEFPGVSGRMEFVQKEPFAVIVDYAHTPDSLKAVYQTLSTKKRSSASRMICVLGAAGGGRDKWKRPEMGKVAADYCDEIILTNEDPYDEDPQNIIKEIASGFNKSHQQILDRKEAIKKAVNSAKDGDIVIITGKGSEKWMRLAIGKKIPWSDKEIIKENF